MAVPMAALAPLDIAALDALTARAAAPPAAATSPATTAASSTSGSGGSDKGWTPAEDEKLRAAVKAEGPRNWKLISQTYFKGTFSDTQVLNRWYKVLRPGLVKGLWTREEDEIIIQCMAQGVTKWSDIAARIPGRLGKQCRERWMNHLDPTLKKDKWAPEEDAALFAAQARFGNAWTKIAELLHGRSENAVKNRWNSADMRRARARRAQGQQPHQSQQQPSVQPPSSSKNEKAAPLQPALPTLPVLAPAIQQQQYRPQHPAPMVVAPARDTTPVKRSPPHHLHDNGADMDSISSISSASATSIEESESESEAEEEPDVQRSQLPPRHRGLQHHHTQHATAAPPAQEAPLSGLAGLALAASALCDASPVPAAPAKAQQPPQPQLPSQRMRDVISLLFASLRSESDSTRRALLQDALDAATQEKPPMVNFIEGALVGASCDLAVESDRLFLLDQILAATHRGVFGPCTFRL